MIEAQELSTDHIVRALRILVTDLNDKHSPFNKNEEYMRNLAGWIACAAARLEETK